MDTLSIFNPRSRRRFCQASLLALAVWGASNLFAAGTNAPPAKAPLVVPRSVFVDDLTKGKDPFFPATSRRVDNTVSAIPQGPATPVKPTAEQIQLKGLFKSANRQLALINNRTFEAGEQADVKITDGKVRLRCVEIRPRSVIILLPGETQRRELHLNEKL